MAFREVYGSTETGGGTEFRPGEEFILRMEGTQTVLIESAREDADPKVWIKEGELTDADGERSLHLQGSQSLVFRINATTAGSTVFYESMQRL